MISCRRQIHGGDFLRNGFPLLLVLMVVASVYQVFPHTHLGVSCSPPTPPPTASPVHSLTFSPLHSPAFSPPAAPRRRLLRRAVRGLLAAHVTWSTLPILRRALDQYQTLHTSFLGTMRTRIAAPRLTRAAYMYSATLNLNITVKFRHGMACAHTQYNI